MVLSCGAIIRGIQVSKARPGKVPRNSGGATPMMVIFWRLTRIVLPITPGSALKRRFHRL